MKKFIDWFNPKCPNCHKRWSSIVTNMLGNEFCCRRSCIRANVDDLKAAGEWEY